MRVRKNAVQVLIPQYGLEGPIYFAGKDGKSQVASLDYDASVPSLAVTTGGTVGHG